MEKRITKPHYKVAIIGQKLDTEALISMWVLLCFEDFSQGTKKTISKTGKRLFSTTVMGWDTKEVAYNPSNTTALYFISEAIISQCNNYKV